MKNIQIIDGAVNSTFEIYQVSNAIFETVFPQNTNIAFLRDLEITAEVIKDQNFWDILYERKMDKEEVVGIHGTLHLTGSYCLEQYYPTRKENEVRNI